MSPIDEQDYFVSLPAPTGSAAELDRKLGALEGKSFGKATELLGCYDLGTCVLSVDHLPSRPDGSAGLVRVGVKQKRAQIAPAFFSTPERKRACEDFLARQVARALDEVAGTSDAKAGHVSVGTLGQEVLERTLVRVTDDHLVLRLSVALPHGDGKILTVPAADLLLRRLPAIVEQSLVGDAIDESALRRQVSVVEDQNHIRARLEGSGLAAFIANGAVLARRDDGSDLPLERERRVEFRAPERLQVTLNAPNAGAVMGMGVPLGVTVIVGGAEHGKSTLLQALQRGVYDHIPGDGRERVMTARSAVRIDAEQGRSVRQVDVSPFVGALPDDREVRAFETHCASRCLSQAASLMEALELGATVLLLDEDASAPNLLYRDARMQQLVARDNEPLTTLLDQARELHNRLGVSTVLVTGSGGDYLEAADTVISVNEFVPQEVTSRARTIAAALPTRRQTELRHPVYRPQRRLPLATGLIEASEALAQGRADPRAIAQLVEPGQARAVAYAISRLAKEYFDGDRNLAEALVLLEQDLDRYGLEILYPESVPSQPPLSRPRALEVGAVLNRMAELRVELAEEEEA